jgi:nitroreductase
MAMNTSENDETLLEAQIVHRAHIIDKTLTASPERRDYLLSNHGPVLQCLLKEWAEQGYEVNLRISWAREVMEDLETGRGPQLTNEEKYSGGDLMGLLRSRRSVRNWTDEPIGDDLLEQLFQAARWAPSSGNRQSVRLVVLRSDKCKAAVHQLKEDFFCRAPLIILVGVDLRVYKPDELRGLPFLDAAAAIQNMLLAAHASGLGCVWGKLGVEDWETRRTFYFDMKRRLNLPGSFFPVSVVAVGWPAKPTRTPPRHEVDKFVTFENEGFAPDDYPEWRPDYWHLYCIKIKQKVYKLVKSFWRVQT